MARDSGLIKGPMRIHLLLSLQIFQLAILLLHDWVQLSPWNDVAAARRVHNISSLMLGTIISSLLPAVGLALSFIYLKSGWPTWLYFYLLATYGFLFLGELEAWWIPYLLSPQPKRAAEYDRMYGKTWSFLPVRHGIRINALHVTLHTATLGTLLALASHFLSPAN